ncbi:hypothetical protein ABZ896_12415 [Streptomyces sp. NPDC047072]|uniref:hypothetical protein n=1 Tax=Streptomyces sp. NPDC047072 TaxID=3154809 RepID=UPI0033EC3380
MYQPPMLFRFIARGATPEAALALAAAEDNSRPSDPFVRRADLTKVDTVVVVPDRAPLRAVAAGYFGDSYAAFDGADGGPLTEDDAEWLADRLIEDDDPRVATGSAGALLLDQPGDAPAWLFFGWTVPAHG